MDQKRRDKKEIREKMLEKRNSLSAREQARLARQIAERVLATDIYRESSCICAYQAFRGEVSCQDIIRQAYADGKKVYVPVTDAAVREMQFCRIVEHTAWRKGAYGIMEPVHDKNTEKLTDAALVLMPGLAFDEKRHRLGYGGGYYDKFFARRRDCGKIALCYDFQIVEGELPFESHDILPDYIVTECRIL